MPSITEGQLQFDFPAEWIVSQFDQSSFYRHQFQSAFGGTKAIDILALQNRQCCWLIEIKDYRQHARTKPIDLADEIAFKVRDTLSGLIASNLNANDADEKSMANSALQCPRIRVVLHLEQPAKHSKLFPRPIDPASVREKLKQRLKSIDPHPLVVELNNMHGVAWIVC